MSKKTIRTKFNGEEIRIKSHMQKRAKTRANMKGKVVRFSKKALKDGLGMKEAINIANMSFRNASTPEEAIESFKKRDLINFIKRKTRSNTTEVKIYGYDVFIFVKGQPKTLLTLPESLHEHWDYYSKNVLKIKRAQEKRAEDIKYGRIKEDSNGCNM